MLLYVCLGDKYMKFSGGFFSDTPAAYLCSFYEVAVIGHQYLQFLVILVIIWPAPSAVLLTPTGVRLANAGLELSCSHLTCVAGP